MISVRRLLGTSSSYLAAFSTTSKATASSLTDLLTGSYDPLSKKKDDGQSRPRKPRTESGQDQGSRPPYRAGQQARRQAVGTCETLCARCVAAPFACVPSFTCPAVQAYHNRGLGNRVTGNLSSVEMGSFNSGSQEQDVGAAEVGVLAASQLSRQGTQPSLLSGRTCRTLEARTSLQPRTGGHAQSAHHAENRRL